MNKTVEEKIYVAVNEYKERMNRFIDSFEDYQHYNKINSFSKKFMYSKIDSIFSDLYASVRCGFIAEEEVKEFKKTVDSITIDTIRIYNDYMREKLGEKEFDIQQIMVEDGKTRQEAIDWYNYLWSIEI